MGIIKGLNQDHCFFFLMYNQHLSADEIGMDDAGLSPRRPLAAIPVT